jgi:protein-tyrosine phosphatase
MHDDLHVDFLGPSQTGLPGRLGLARAPGLRWPDGPDQPGGRDRRGGSHGRDPLADDLRVLAREHGATLLVTLLSQREVAALGDFEGAARSSGLRWLHHPIPDMATPASPAAAARIVDELTAHLAGGGTAVLHCLAGLGRTGTVAACLLVARGRGAVEAVAAVRSARPGSVQTAAQEAFVEDFERFHRGEDGRQPAWHRRGDV